MGIQTRLLAFHACWSLALLSPACSSVNAHTRTDGANNLPAGDAGAGVGAPCTADIPCRSGLVCGAQASCELGRSAAPGASCVLNGECQAGLYCGPDHLCDARGGGAGGAGGAAGSGAGAASGGAGSPSPAAGEAGASCQSDSDCNDALRCDPTGFSASCQSEGKGDLGAACATSADCLGGLGCSGKACIQGPVGAPNFGGSLWQGESCPDESKLAPTAYFHLPRAAGDGDFYALPFPNDARTRGGHPDLSGHPSPGPDLLGFDPVDRYLRAIEQERDGFGAYSTVFFRFSEGVDLPSFRAPGVITLVDVTTGDPAFGQGLGLGWYAYGGRGKYICSNWLGVRPGAGQPLSPGHTYAAVLTSAGRTSAGKAFAQGADLGALLAEAAPADGALGAAHAAYAPLRQYLQSRMMTGADVLNAAVFTVGHVADPARKLAAAIAAAPAPTASGWVKCGAGPSPCPDATGDRACGAGSAAFDELQALVALPVFQAGTAPYLSPADGGNIDASGASVTPVRTEQVCLSLTVPRGAPMPAGGWPVVVYAHGTGGSFRSHINEGVAASLAAADSGSGAVPFAVLGIDQVQHGPRRGASTAAPSTLFFNFANPAAALGNPLQGAADQLSLGRFAASFALDAGSSPTGAAVRFDPAAIVFWGHSQGATEGGIAIPYSADFKGAVLSGEGASLLDALLAKTQPVNIAGVVPFVLEDGDPAKPAQLLGGTFHPVLSLLQAYIDPADPLNHAAAMATTPPAGIPPHHVFQPYGLADSFAPPATEAAYALAAGLGLVSSDASVATPDAIGPLMASPSPLKGNKMVGMATVTAAVREYAAPPGVDGHFVATKNAAAARDVARFLAQIAQGKVPQVGP